MVIGGVLADLWCCLRGAGGQLRPVCLFKRHQPSSSIFVFSLRPPPSAIQPSSGASSALIRFVSILNRFLTDQVTNPSRPSN
ncbi:hypothetical protein BDW67DRAFT_158636 [Aspergillus spinulosporus]